MNIPGISALVLIQFHKQLKLLCIFPQITNLQYVKYVNKNHWHAQILQHVKHWTFFNQIRKKQKKSITRYWSWLISEPAWADLHDISSISRSYKTKYKNRHISKSMPQHLPTYCANQQNKIYLSVQDSRKRMNFCSQRMQL